MAEKKAKIQLHPDPSGFVRQAYPLLQQKFGKVRCALTYDKPHELAVSVILSAQCTDVMVNRVTPALFEKYRSPEDFASAKVPELEDLIRKTGFFHNKAKSIIGFNRDLVEKHGGVMPQTLEELVKMPGVGRKTANVILQELFDTPSGVVVDTHCARLSHVLGLTDKTDPVKIERDLMEILPRAYWIDWSLYMISLGRSACTARKRECNQCVLQKICLSSTAK